MENQEGGHTLMVFATWAKHLFSLASLFFLILIAFNQGVHQYLLEYANQNFGNRADFTYQAIKSTLVKPNCNLSLPVDELVEREINEGQKMVLINLSNLFSQSADDPQGNHNSFFEQKQFTASLDLSLTGYSYDQKKIQKIKERAEQERQRCKTDYDQFKKHMRYKTSDFRSFQKMEESVLSFVKLPFVQKLQIMLSIVVLVAVMSFLGGTANHRLKPFKSKKRYKTYWAGLTVACLISLGVSVFTLIKQYNLNALLDYTSIGLGILLLLLSVFGLKQTFLSKIHIQEGSMASRTPALPSLLIHALVTALFAVLGPSTAATANDQIPSSPPGKTYQAEQKGTQNMQLASNSIAPSSTKTNGLELATDLQLSSITSSTPNSSTSRETGTKPASEAISSSEAKLSEKSNTIETVSNRSRPSISRQETNSIDVSQFKENASQTLVNWSAAWSAQDVQGYLSFYSDEFTPSSGLSRKNWVEQRYDRIENKESIEVFIDNVEIEQADSMSMKVIFDQFYRSESYSDQSKKIVELKQEGDRWRILSEQSL